MQDIFLILHKLCIPENKMVCPSVELLFPGRISPLIRLMPDDLAACLLHEIGMKKYEIMK